MLVMVHTHCSHGASTYETDRIAFWLHSLVGPAFLLVKTAVDFTVRGGYGLPIDDRFPVLSLDCALELAGMCRPVVDVSEGVTGGSNVHNSARIEGSSSLLHCVSGLRLALQLALHRKDRRAALSHRSVYHELLWAILKFDLLGTFFFHGALLLTMA